MNLTQLAKHARIGKFTIYGRYRLGARTYEELTRSLARGKRIDTPHGFLNIPEIARLTGIHQPTLYSRRRVHGFTWKSLTLSDSPYISTN